MRAAGWLSIAAIIFAIGFWGGSPLSSIAAVLAFALYSARLLKERFAFAVAMLSFTVWRWTIFGALVAIEYGAYMPEIGRQGRFIDATAAFFLFVLVMYFSAELTFGRFSGWLTRIPGAAPRSNPKALSAIFPAALTSAGVAALYLIGKGIREGFPLFTHTDRFAFRLQVDDYWFNWVLGNAIVFPALLGVCFAYGRTALTRGVAACAMAGFVGSMVLFSEKFFSLLMMACVFGAPILLRRNKLGFSAGAYTAFALLGLGAICATWYIYSDYGNTLPAYTLKKIMTRAAAQGELWFSAFSDARLLKGDPGQWRQMLDSLWLMDGHQRAFEQGNGIFYMMRLYTPDDVWASILNSRGAVTYTAGTEAYFILTLGIALGALAMAVLGLYVGWVSAYFAFAMRRPELVRIVLAAKTLAYTLDGAHQASLWNIFGARAVAMLLAIVAYEVAAAFFRARLSHPPSSPSSASLARRAHRTSSG
ncbi:MAG TPA: DUF6418 domain-containing protein [Caulobacterales bacterium]|nr:DUF6418 domain-containing protein [Caulobacterales bacterium]